MRTSKLCSGGKGISLRHGKQLLRCLPLVGMLFATSSVNAADSPGGVKFNPGVRYSQWAINSRLYDFRGNQKAYGFAPWDATKGKGNYANEGNMKNDYVAGLVGKATLEASDYYSSFDWAEPWFKSAEAYATDYTYSAQAKNEMTLDNMNAAKMALHIVNNKWASADAKTTATTAINAIIKDLKYYNENYVIGGTKSNVKEASANDVQKKMLGGWFHKYNYVDQVWCDGMYMGPALLAQLINYKDASTNVSNDDWSLLTKQFTITWEQLRDAKTGLMYHGMTATPTTTDWSSATDATSYHSGAFWGRANAWYMLALVDVLEVMPSSNANYSTLKGYLEILAESIASYQNEDGTWYQVLDQKDNALSENYEESSCSALFTAAYLKAIRLKLLDSKRYETMAKKAYVALVDKFMSYDKNDNSKIQILSSCCSAGLGTNSGKLRDGSRSYYITGNDSKAVTGKTGFYYTEGKVLGGFIMAATEYERAYQNQESKQILFAKDLAPKYDFSTTACSLDATAYGTGAEKATYQWYKDDTAVANANSATFSPKESGRYYCTATVGKNTIQTSTTTVTGSETPTTKKYTVTATAGDGGTVAINSSNGNVTSGTDVEENTSLTFTATANDGYEFVNWTNASNEAVSNENPYTAKVSADINIKANFKKKEVAGGETTTKTVTFPVAKLMTLDSNPENGQVALLTTEAITITAGDNIAAGNNSGIKLSDNTFFITIAADKAKITKITAVTNSSKDKLTLNPIADKKENSNKTWTYYFSTTKPESVKISGGSSSVSISEITVEYESSTPSTPKTNLTAEYATSNVGAIVGDADIPAPELTVTAGETPLEEGTGYSVSYTSGDENVVKVQEDGTLDAVGKGTATITATITPADGTKYNNKTLTFTINVSARPLKAVFSTNAVSANVGDEARALPTLTVTDVNLQQQVSDYTVAYSSSNEEVATVVGDKLNFVGAGKTTIKVTVTPTDVNTFASCEASFDVSVADKTTTDPTQKAVVYDFTTSVGNTESANANIKVNSDNIMFGTNFKANESKYLTITPNGDGGFKAGDVITLKGYCPKKTSGILIYADPTDDEPQFQSPAFAATEVTYTFTVQKDSPVLYLGRFGGSSTYVTYLNVTRPATSGNKTRLTSAFERNSDVIINKPDNYTIGLPALTVKDGNDVFNGQYTVDYTSNDEAVATVDGNAKTITIKTPGTVTILATVTPNDDNSYEGCTATYTITVKDPTPLVISTMDVMMNATDAKVKQPIIKVYGDDDKLLTLNTDYTLSYSVKSATEGETANVRVLDDGTFKVEGKEYNWKEGSSVITVTATPKTEHIGDTYINGTLDFIYNVVKGKLTPAFMNNFASEVIKIKQYDKQTNNNSKKFRVPLIYNGEDVSEYFKYTYTVKKSDGTLVSSKTLNNGNEFTFKPTNKGEFTIYVSAEPKTGKTDQDDYTDVYNAPAPMQFNVSVDPNYIRPVITFNPESVQMYVGTTEGAPDVTVTDGKDEISDYNLKWVSFSPNYVKVDEATGKLEAVSEGQGSVRITVTGDNLESMTAFLSVYVDDPAVYRTKSTEKYGNQRKMWNQDRTMSVTLGGWMFPNDVTNTKYSDEGLRREYCWADNATQPKWKMIGFDRFVSGEKSKNARQENGSNAMPNTTMVSSADFKDRGEVKDAMFNVPCSGSYLTFNPKTNGTVSVHIFQNGAFDSGVYRPQRRVFVMDEQGNFVQSTPEIENANGKPTGGLKAIGNYKWDINPKGANTAPAIEDVRLHFKNIPTDFDMTTEKFQNNIYESNLSNDIVPNAAYNKDVPGSNGWCVLADSPVTYSFKVKAGKTYYLWNFGSKIGFYGFSFEEDATKPEVDKVTYKDDETNNIVSTPEGHVAKVSINRSFQAGVWSTCVLPFSLNMSQVDAIFGDTYRFGNENGTEILYFDRVDENGKVWFVRHAYNTIVANKPFLIKPTKDVNGINTADCAEYPYVTIEAPKDGKPAAWCSDGNYAWVSSYNNDMTLSTGDGYIGGTSGNFIQSNNDGVKVKGFRGFLKGLTPAAKTHVLSTMTASNTDGDDNTTFIDGLVVDGDGNFVPTAADGKVYSINGQLVGKDMKSLGSLPSGVYIINGKKYIK